MTLYRSANRAALGRQETTADIPARSRTAADITQELAASAAGDPPTYLDTAAALGWDEAARRINAWHTAGKTGDWRDAEYDDPSPLDTPDGTDFEALLNAPIRRQVAAAAAFADALRTAGQRRAAAIELIEAQQAVRDAGPNATDTQQWRLGCAEAVMRALQLTGGQVTA